MKTILSRIDRLLSHPKGLFCYFVLIAPGLSYLFSGIAGLIGWTLVVLALLGYLLIFEFSEVKCFFGQVFSWK